jgi:hypothetical protein
LYSSPAYINKHKELVTIGVYAHQYCTERNVGWYREVRRRGNIIPRRGVERGIFAAAFLGFVMSIFQAFETLRLGAIRIHL